MTHLAQICIFPIKSLDRIDLQSSEVLPSGALKGDREFAIFDEADRVVNGKRTAKIHGIRSQYDLLNRSVTLSATGLGTQTFHLEGDRSGLDAWLSEFFDFKVHLKQNLEMGFPDDPQSPGPTVISTQTIATVASWYEAVTRVEMRSRLRTNLELDAPEAFWEDQLFGAADEMREFSIGSVRFQGVNPCQRCIVPTRDSVSGDATFAFQKTFLTNRSATLPESVDRSQFNHFYRLSVNTRVTQVNTRSIGGGWLRVHDDVER
jgi:uncharacterized protein